MSRTLTPPSAGQPIRASFFAELLREVRANRLVNGSGYRTKRTPNGTSLIIGKGKDPSTPPLPWSFSCYEDPDTHERTGGWRNCRLQIGYNNYLKSPDVLSMEDISFVSDIRDCDMTDDGEYWVEVDVLEKLAKIIIRSDGDFDVLHPNDPEKNIVRIRIGLVEDGKLKYGFHHNPVVYSYL